MSAIVSLNRVMSFDQHVSDQADATFLDLMFDDQAETPYDAVYQNEMRALVINMLATLPRREWSILIDRFGFDGRERLTLDEVSVKWHVSKERIRQLEKTALRKLRSLLRNTRLSQEIFGRAPRRREISVSKFFKGENGKMPKRSTR